MHFRAGPRCLGGGKGTLGGSQKLRAVIWRLVYFIKGEHFMFSWLLKERQTEISCNESPRKRPALLSRWHRSNQWQQRAVEGQVPGPPGPGRHGACPPPAPTQLGSWVFCPEPSLVTHHPHLAFITEVFWI